MSPKPWMFLSAMVLALASFSGEAEARFGKRDDDKKEKPARKVQQVKSAPRRPAPQVHAATAPYAPEPRRSYGHSYGRVTPRPHVHTDVTVVATTGPEVYGTYVPVEHRRYERVERRRYVTYERRRSTTVRRSQPSSDSSSGRAFFETHAQVFSYGAALGAQMLLEGERLGFNAEVNGYALLREDGYPGSDPLQTLDLHLTYAVFSNSHGRFRIHLGADSVFAEDLIVLGPSIGVSTDVDLLGPFGLHGSLQMTPFPYHQVDSQAGVSLALGPLSLRGGLRATWLDDAGLVDGVSHEETFVGPYAGVALVF